MNKATKQDHETVQSLLKVLGVEGFLDLVHEEVEQVANPNQHPCSEPTLCYFALSPLGEVIDAIKDTKANYRP